MNRSQHFLIFAVVAAGLALSGCATTETPPKTSATPRPTAPRPPTPRPPPPVVPSTPTVSADQVALNEGIELYNQGSYNEAIKRLGAADVTGGSRATQVSAHKYMAFSYCVTSRPAPCRQHFEKAFKLDPAFALAPGESGHPLWGPVFAKAKKSK
ncbi:TssQ family T6SS-associated lipoprotein [Massilia pseudoviolaceinigra]|uniref:TssQ family T6SS-associated lipoprotein n=1 Tax=Massilia pseudoviolaceinigra TaxID=3057165 RepID=UPI00279640FA|nr:TssQ family T6SS-associated lipoprotein [Massilia sp. CCM 9206]MDQ1919063.1 TssQ family T6SS-associated lipoprotein [Massilia sp. CCM 9206]